MYLSGFIKVVKAPPHFRKKEILGANFPMNFLKHGIYLLQYIEFVRVKFNLSFATTYP